MLENCVVLCKGCHAVKTGKTDIPRIAKVKRVHRNHIGAKVSRSPLPGGKKSPWRKTFNHGWVRRVSKASVEPEEGE